MSNTKLAFILVCIGMILVGSVSALALKYYTADVRGRVDANEQIKSGSNRIVQYDSFFNACSSIQGIEGTIDALLEELASTVDENNKQRIQTNITGNKAARAQAIAQYNADARKNYTDGQFRDSDLPYQLNTTNFIKGHRTSCGVN